MWFSQNCSRIYIVGRPKNKGGLKDFQHPEKDENKNVSIHNIIIQDDTDFMPLRDDTKNHLKVWQEFLDLLKPEEVPPFPIWAMEFGASFLLFQQIWFIMQQKLFV